MELYIKDKEKLKAYKSKTSKNSGSTVEYEQNKITLKNAPLKMLASQLKSLYGERFSFNENDTTKYNFEIELKNSLETTFAFLEKRYGISSKDSQQEIIEYNIVDKT